MDNPATYSAPSGLRGEPAASPSPPRRAGLSYDAPMALGTRTEDSFPYLATDPMPLAGADAASPEGLAVLDVGS